MFRNMSTTVCRYKEFWLDLDFIMWPYAQDLAHYPAG